MKRFPALRSRAVARLVFLAGILAAGVGCGRGAMVQTELPIRRVVIYRNGVAYFERSGHIDEGEVRFKMKPRQVGDFLASLAVMEEEGTSSVRSAAFPLKVDDENKEAKPGGPREEEKLRTVVVTLDGHAHNLAVGYIAESPVWRPSYRLVVQPNGKADLQAWGIVQNLSGEDWKNIRLSLVAGAPIAFEAQLARPIIPDRPVVSDMGEIIAVVPKGDTTLQPDRDADGIPDSGDAEVEKADKPAQAAQARGGAAPAPPPPPPSPAATRGPGRYREEGRVMPGMPRNVNALAAIAAQAGSTRYDVPLPINVPDKSATMVLLVATSVQGEALFLYAPDGGVPESQQHPFRVVRFQNDTKGLLERGPIAVFEAGSFLGQGLVDPLPAGGTATVPFALERAVAVEQETKWDERGERLAKIDAGALYIERDAVRKTIYRVKNGTPSDINLRIRHPRIHGARLHQPPAKTEDNVGTGTALVPATIKPGAPQEIVVDERSSNRRHEDWFSDLADKAVKAYIADPKSDGDTVVKLRALWLLRDALVKERHVRTARERERNERTRESEEIRRNLKALEKTKGADALQKRLTAQLGVHVARLETLSKELVEGAMNQTELEIRWREVLKDIHLEEVASPQK